MKYILFLIVCSGILFTGCKTTTLNSITHPAGWYSIAEAEDVEIFIDTANITHKENITYAREKRIFLSPESKAKYVNKIRESYKNLGKAEKADRWNDFSYCIYNCLYECTNNRFRILSVEDYDSQGKLIVRSMPAKGDIRWLKVEPETVGDYTFFSICDYGK